MRENAEGTGEGSVSPKDLLLIIPCDNHQFEEKLCIKILQHVIENSAHCISMLYRKKELNNRLHCGIDFLTFCLLQNHTRQRGNEKK